ncbi:MAG TPA: peptidylprolyl isomerase [Bryobacteraceae bacterium]|nr:peptidylprolyl isomerase [Bryobacteraceae bacterium]
MKPIILTIVLTSIALAQPPATKSGAPKARPRPASTGRLSAANPALLKAKAPDVFKAGFTTTKGDFVIEVHRDWAPNGADRFYNMVKSGFFTEVYFFRVVPKFMVQFGISGTPKVAAAWEKANIQDDPQKESNKRGNVTFAQAGRPNTRASQLFINFADNTFLDKQNFPPFGTVISGMDVVDQIYSGYGEMSVMGGRGPDPGRIESEGNAYLVKNFPKLDKINTAKILPADAPAK